MANRLRLAVPEEWERWAYAHRPWERDPERPQSYEDAVRLPVGRAGRLWLPSGHIVLPPMRGGARLFDDASSQYLASTSTPVTAAPFTVAGWGRSNDSTLQQYVLWIGDSDSNSEAWRLAFRGDAVGDPIIFLGRSSGVSGIATTTTGYTAGTWHHVCGVEASPTDRRVFIDGGSKGTNALSEMPASVDAMEIGRIGGATPSNYFSGDLAEIAIWDAALSDADVALLAKAVSPLMVHPDALVFYCPIIGNYSPEIDVVGGVNMTVTGATKSAHPRVFYPPAPQIRAPSPAEEPPAAALGGGLMRHPRRILIGL